MKIAKLFPLLVVLTAAVTGGTGGRAEAAEVYFDTVSTEKVVRGQGAYFGLFGGWSGEFSPTTSGAIEGFSSKDEGGWFLGGEVGYEFSTSFPIRPGVEAELFYLRNNYRSESGGLDARATVGQINLMANVVLALDLSNQVDEVGEFLAAFHPYIGAGLGAAYASVKDGSRDLADGGTAGIEGGSNLLFAYQVFGGLEFDLGDYVSLYGEYRRLWTEDLPGGDLGKVSQNLWNLGFKVRY